MRKYFRLSLKKRLGFISIASFLPMLCLVVILLMSLVRATHAYSGITQSVSYANVYVKEFKERIDYSMYLAVIGNKSVKELENRETTVNGIKTVNPYKYIDKMMDVCDELADMATVDSNRYQIRMLKSSLKYLRHYIETLENNIENKVSYDYNMEYLDGNIRNLTSLIQEGIQDYIYTETMNFDNIRAQLDKQNADTLKVSILISVIAAIASWILTGIASKNVIVPIQKLCKQTNRVAEGDFTVNTNVQADDEIAVLTESFNDMTKEIGVLVEDIKKQQIDLRNTEIKLLQAQINPHFLYNTLDAIVWLAEEKKTDEVVSMVTSLSEFFRTTLSAGRDFITVKEEESHIESYLQIQRFRYEDIMEYEIDICPEIYDFLIPKLTLQPLVENALYHGIKNKRGKGKIKITGKKEGDKIIFHVMDNGRGMDESTLRKLRETLNNDDNKIDRKDSGFGLVNVNQRIRQYYGKEDGLSFESEENKGTIASVIIRAKKIEPFS